MKTLLVLAAAFSLNSQALTLDCFNNSNGDFIATLVFAKNVQPTYQLSNQDWGGAGVGPIQKMTLLTSTQTETVYSIEGETSTLHLAHDNGHFLLIPQTGLSDGYSCTTYPQL